MADLLKIYFELKIFRKIQMKIFHWIDYFRFKIQEYRFNIVSVTIKYYNIQ
jgi:hypothetical protein